MRGAARTCDEFRERRWRLPVAVHGDAHIPWLPLTDSGLVASSRQGFANCRRNLSNSPPPPLLPPPLLAFGGKSKAKLSFHFSAACSSDGNSKVGGRRPVVKLALLGGTTCREGAVVDLAQLKDWSSSSVAVTARQACRVDQTGFKPRAARAGIPYGRVQWSCYGRDRRGYWRDRGRSRGSVEEVARAAETGGARHHFSIM